MSQLDLQHPISNLTVGDLKELIREIIREERENSFYIDTEGYLVFSSEKDYADYLDKQTEKLPGEVRAYFIDEQGFKYRYSDFELIPKKVEELSKIKTEPTVEGEQVWEGLRDLGVDV